MGSPLAMEHVTLASIQSRDILRALGMDLEAFVDDDEESR